MFKEKIVKFKIKTPAIFEYILYINQKYKYEFQNKESEKNIYAMQKIDEKKMI